MNNPPFDPASPVLSGDPTSSFHSIPEPANPLKAALHAQRLAEARNLTRRYVLMATGLALFPLPVVDIAAVAAIQIKLVHDLARLYELPFESKIAKPLFMSLLSCGAVSFGGIALMSLGMSVPGLNTLVGAGFSGSMAGITLATSEIFIRHFEAGGTLADFDPTATPPAAATQPSSSSIPSAESEQLERVRSLAAEPLEVASPLNPEQLEDTSTIDQGLITTDEGPSITDHVSDFPDQRLSTRAQQETVNSSGSGQQRSLSLSLKQESTPTASSIPDQVQPEASSMHDQGHPQGSSTHDQGHPEGSSTQELDKPHRPSVQHAAYSVPVNTQAEDSPETPLNSTASFRAAEPEVSKPDTALADLDRISGIGVVYVRRLREAGLMDCSSLAALKPDALRQILGPRVSLASARDFISQAKALSRVNSS